MAALLALLSAVWFALSAALQQRGQFSLARSGTPVEGVTGLFRLLAVPVWPLGTLILFAGYATQGAALVISAIVAVLLLWLHTKSSRALRAAVLGVCAGLFFGLSASFAKPVLADLHVRLGEAAGAWQTWALLGFGFIAFVIQQMSLAPGQLAPAMAALLAALAGAVLITLANRETAMPGVERSAAGTPHADPSPA